MARKLRGAVDEAKPDGKARCPWSTKAINIPYHDEEWGVPVHDDQTWFEFLILEGAQAGLSWDTVLQKRERYRKVFAGFDPRKVARFDGAKKRQLLGDAGIIRNRLKIAAAIDNAKEFLKLQEEFGSFDKYIWNMVGGAPIQNRWEHHKRVPAKTELAVTVSKDLQKRGFRFVGPTIIYALMQATGIVNDHLLDCFRHEEIAGMR